MKRVALLAAAACALFAGSIVAQETRQLTLFSSTGFSGARFTVSGDRTNMNSLPFQPQSVMLQGGGTWQLCGRQDYRDPCMAISRDQRELRLPFARIESVRAPVTATPGPAPAPAAGWQEVARRTVTDANRNSQLPVNNQQRFREVMLCSERNAIRIRRAEVRLDGRHWQRLFVPLVLQEGQCSDPIDLNGEDRRITAFRFEYEAWTAGWSGGTLVAKARGAVTPQPR